MNDFKLGMTIGAIIGNCGTLILLFLQGLISIEIFVITISVVNLTLIGTTLLIEFAKKPN